MPLCTSIAHRIDHAAKLDDDPVPGALYDPPVVERDGRIDKVAAQCAQPRQRALLVGAREPAVADDIGNQDRRQLPGLGHWTLQRRAT
jgi:hypothetical protein